MKFIIIALLSLTLLNVDEIQAAIPKYKILPERKAITVAIIDTGIDIKNPVLEKKLWLNPGESGLDSSGHDKRTNHIDDDHNGFIDDVHGWNFVSNDNMITDNYDHGTHIAGIILQQGLKNPEIEVQLMILKYYDTPKNKKQTPFEFSKRALEYAQRNGAQIINYSGGGSISDEDELNWIQKARNKDILLVSATGNDGAYLGMNPYFPASYNLDNILQIGSVDEDFKKSEWSNFDDNTIFAPGENISSILPGSKIGSMSGTSQATAWVTGFIIGQNLNYQNLKTKSEKIKLAELIKNETLKQKRRIAQTIEK